LTTDEIIISSLEEYVEERYDSNIQDLFENYEDVEIAYELWENTRCSTLNLVDIEQEIRYLRKNRKLHFIE
jgi:hypothetical protein